jgi:glycosyltransferase involved in cell wall biosynthesis
VLEIMSPRVERRRVPRVHLRPVGRTGGERLAVCLYTPSYAPSGMGGHMVDLAAEYAPTADVTVMAWPTEGGRRLLDAAAAVGAVPVALPHPRDPAFADAVVRRLRDVPVDVFHGHVGTGREDFDGARAARRAGVPTVVQTLHLPWQLGSHKHRVPFFSSLHPLDRVLTVSAGQRRTYERIGVRPELLRTVPNGIRARGPGPGRAAARRALGLRDDQPVVLTVGRLVAQKGHRTLVAAVPALAARFPDPAGVVIGDGGLHEPLARQAAELGVAHSVHLPGFRPDARTLLDAADVFVLPSRQEAMPLAALEAMDAGLPVVATRVDGSTEVVVDGVTGRLVPRDDAAALAGALGDLLADGDLRTAYGAAGQERFRSRYTSARMAEQTLGVYRELLTGQLAHRL